MEKRKSKINASRICEAIARIGYKPQSAILDLVDNSVTASAKTIEIRLFRVEDTTRGARNNLAALEIRDDGAGMNEAEIESALELGSLREYPNGSLSKYGLGLKSAGLSLGPKITVTSKKGGVVERFFLDEREIDDEYVIFKEDYSGEYDEYFESLESGTVVRVDDCATSEVTSNQSCATTIKNLKEQAGVIYHSLFETNSLTLKLIEGEDEEEVKPRDIMFLSSAVNFDSTDYVPNKAVLTCSEEIIVSDKEEIPPVELKAVLFPMASLANCMHPSLTDDDRDEIRNYDIKAKNRGMFIYRNGRLIVWGDSLDGLIGKDDQIFRACVHLSSEHDDLLHVDVSKQRVNYDEEFLEKVTELVRPTLKAKQKRVRAICNEFLDNDPGESFNEVSSEIESEDLEDQTEANPSEEKKKKQRRRRKKIEERSEETAPAETEDSNEGVFRKVRYVDYFVDRPNSFLEYGHDPDHGAFIAISKQHRLYRTILGSAPEGSSARIAIESILWAFGTGFHYAEEKMTDLDQELVREVIERITETSGYNLSRWCAKNEDLWERE